MVVSRLMKVRAHANTNAEGLLRDVVGNRIKESASDYLNGLCRRRAASDFSVQSCLLVNGLTLSWTPNLAIMDAHTYTHEQLPSNLYALSALTN